KTSRHDAWCRSEKRDTAALTTDSNRVPRSTTGFRSLSFATAWKCDQADGRSLALNTISGGKVDHKPLGPSPVPHTRNIRPARHSCWTAKTGQDQHRGGALRRINCNSNRPSFHSLVRILRRTLPDFGRMPLRFFNLL